MEPSRFDRWSRQLGAVGSRRGIVRAVVAAVAIGVTGGTTGTDAAPRRRVVCRNPGVQCTSHGQCCTGNCRRISASNRSPRYQCACSEPLRNCGGTCVDLMTDPRNCGRCGNRCKDGESCCDGSCVRLGSDDHCLGCGDVCADDETCGADGCSGFTCSPGSGYNHCVTKLATGAVDAACYVRTEYGSTGGASCTSDAECQTDCPTVSGYQCYCATDLSSSKGDLDFGPVAGQCIAIVPPYGGNSGTCCYPEAEQGADNDNWYCVIDFEGKQWQDALGGSDVGTTPCSSNSECSSVPACSGLSAPAMCVCPKVWNAGDGEIDGYFKPSSDPSYPTGICRKIEPDE